MDGMVVKEAGFAAAAAQEWLFARLRVVLAPMRRGELSSAIFVVTPKAQREGDFFYQLFIDTKKLSEKICAAYGVAEHEIRVLGTNHEQILLEVPNEVAASLKEAVNVRAKQMQVRPRLHR